MHHPLATLLVVCIFVSLHESTRSRAGAGTSMNLFSAQADNVLDAVLVDPTGQVLDRSSMSDDLFWAIRGGGGGSWGVVYAWKLRLVPVPRNVTVLIVGRTGPIEFVAGLVHRWQYVGPQLPEEFYLSAYVPTGGSSDDGNVSVTFQGQVLGAKELALSALNRSFPELGLTEAVLSELSWIESAAYFAGLSTVDDLHLPNRVYKQSTTPRPSQTTCRRRSRCVTWSRSIVRYLSTGPTTGSIQLDPYGGAMARVSRDETPFPHRAGNLYSIQYGVNWDRSHEPRAEEEEEEYIGWLRTFYSYMTPYVSKFPRAAYVNYLDLDLGENNWTRSAGGSSLEAVARARSSWGAAYFGNNFHRLVLAKTTVDPGNVFNNAQSIPPLLVTSLDKSN